MNQIIECPRCHGQRRVPTVCAFGTDRAQSENRIKVAVGLIGGILIVVGLWIAGMIMQPAKYYPVKRDERVVPDLRQRDAPLSLERTTSANAPGDYASEAEWSEFYSTPEGQRQLERDIRDLEQQLNDPEVWREIERILDE